MILKVHKYQFVILSVPGYDKREAARTRITGTERDRELLRSARHLSHSRLHILGRFECS